MRKLGKEDGEKDECFHAGLRNMEKNGGVMWCDVVLDGVGWCV